MMQQSLCLVLALAASNTLATPANGYPFAAPHPDIARRALAARGMNTGAAAQLVQHAEYKAIMNTPANFDQATEAEKQQFAELQSQAEAMAQQAKEYNMEWQAFAQQKSADCDGIVIFGTCIDKETIKTLSQPPADDDDAKKEDDEKEDSEKEDDEKKDAAPAVPWWYYYYYPYYYYYNNPYANIPVPAGYPKPGTGKTDCGDVKNQGYICNSAFNELDYCFTSAYPYNFGFQGGEGSGNGQVTVAKCCYYGTCAASDDGKIGYCACTEPPATDDKKDSS